jgi:hypothetical protein
VTATYVLIHGACHDGSAFDRVVERLHQQGHTAFAPTVPGNGKEVDKQVSHAESTQSVVDFILNRDLTDFILVGHSYGGTIIANVAEAAPDRVRRLVFWRDVFINDADLDTARLAYQRLSSDPFGQLLEPLDLKRFRTLRIPRRYLIVTEDTVTPPGEWGWHRRLSSRLGTYRLVQMPGSHELVFSNPVGLADKIVEAGGD